MQREYVITVEVYDRDSTKVYLSDVSTCLVSKEQPPEECPDELCYCHGGCGMNTTFLPFPSLLKVLPKRDTEVDDL